jgi:lipopolysaccharide exporter
MSAESRAKRTSFAVDVLKLAGGTTLAQLISILVSPILTRLYSPEVFGIAAVFVSITAIVGEIICLRYNLAIVLPETDQEAASVLGASVASTVMVSLTTVPIVWLGGSAISELLNAPEINPFLWWLIPPVMLIDGLFTSLNYWNSRTKQFGRLSIAQVMSSAVGSGTKIIAGLAGYATSGAFILTNALGLVTAATILGAQVWRDDGSLFRRSISWRGVSDSFKRYHKFPVFSTWAGLVNNLSWQLPVLMLAAFFSPVVVGFYALGNRLARMPMMLVGKSISQVFYQKAASAREAGNLADIVYDVYDRLVAYGLFPMLLLALIGRDLFIAVFGTEWAQAGVYSQILAVYMFFNFIASPIGQLVYVLEKQEVSLLVNISLLLSRFGALWVGGTTGDVLLTLALFSGSGVVVYGCYSMWIVHAAGMALRDWWRQLGRWTLISGAFLVPALALGFVFRLQSWKALIPYGICAIAYYLWLLARDKQTAKLGQRLYLKLRQAARNRDAG